MATKPVATRPPAQTHTEDRGQPGSRDPSDFLRREAGGPVSAAGDEAAAPRRDTRDQTLMRGFLGRLVPHLIASGLAALVGALVGGWITASVVKQDSMTKMRATSYSAYLAEIVPALIVSSDRKLTDEEKELVGHATGTLMLTASKDVLCWAFALEDEVTSASPDADDEFDGLLTNMRREILGEESGLDPSSEECTWSLPF